MGGVFVFNVFVPSDQMRKGLQHLWEGRCQDKDIVGSKVGFRIRIAILTKSILPLKHLCLDGPLELFSESKSGSSGSLRRVDDDVGYCGIDGLIFEWERSVIRDFEREREGTRIGQRRYVGSLSEIELTTWIPKFRRLIPSGTRGLTNSGPCGVLTNNSDGRKEEVNVQDIGGGGEGERGVGTGGLVLAVSNLGSSLGNWEVAGSVLEEVEVENVVAESGELREDAVKEEASDCRRS